MNRRYLVAFPDLRAAPWVENFRRRHDPLHGQIAAHITFVFGDLPDRADMRAACADVAARHLPIAARIDGTTAAPDEHRGGWFVSIGAWPGPAFAALHRDLARAIGRPPVAGFEPHITLARCADEADASAAKRRLDEVMTPFETSIDDLWIVTRDGARLSTPEKLV